MLVTLALLSACGVQGDDVALSGNTPTGYKQLNRGIPVLLGASGAAVTFTDGVGVTAAHNRIVIRRKLWRHPTHDIAFFRTDQPVPEWGEAEIGTRVIAYGNSILRQNRVLETEVTQTRGVWLSYRNDKVFVTQEGFTSGMSGGPVFNEQGQVIGIVQGTITRNPPRDHNLYGRVFRRNGLIIPTSQIRQAFEQMCEDLEWMEPCDIEQRPGGHDAY